MLFEIVAAFVERKRIMKSGAFAVLSPVARRWPVAGRAFRFAVVPLALGGVFSLVAAPLAARSTKVKSHHKAVGKKAKAKLTAGKRLAAHGPFKPMPRYVSVDTIETLRALRGDYNFGTLDPLLGGKPLPPSMQTIPGALSVPMPVAPATPLLPRLRSKVTHIRANAQRFPRPIPPARIPVVARPAVPRWVRYPLEFQLCGIGIGTRAVDKDRFNRIDRYGLFAMHGNPTAVVVSTVGGGVTLQQQPPEVSALFPEGRDGIIPDWAAAITVQLDNNHVEWLYKRDTYSMGFIVDRLGFVDAIVAAGVQSPIARTQLEDPVHTVKLGDDLRKVLFRYGYPDTIETYTTPVAGIGGAAAAGGGGGGGGGGYGGSAGGSSGGGGGGGYGGSSGGGGGGGGYGGSSSGGGGEAAAGGAEAAGNNAYRTFEVRYEQSYNIVFTIRNNRVVRIYIFGDPDFFNDRRRRQFRLSY